MIKITDRKLSIIFHSVFAVAFVVLLIIASFYDLKISLNIGDKESFFGIMFSTIGELPAYLILPICGTVLYHSGYGERWFAVLYKILFALLIFAGFMIWFMMGTKLTPNAPYHTGMSVVYSVLLSGAMIIFGGLVDKEKMRCLTKWCIFAICVMAVSFFVTTLLKYTWSRMRYRTMLSVSDTSGFTAWYLPNGFLRLEDYTSFPSGHTASAANIFVFAMLADFMPKLKRYRIYMYAFAVIFVIFTAMSRIVNCAHFLSDVLFGGTISYICYYIFKLIFFGKGRYTYGENIL